MKNRIKHLIIIAFAALLCTTAQAQTEAETETEAQTEAQIEDTIKLDMVRWNTSMGIQYFSHPTSTYWANRISLQYDFFYFGLNVFEISFGKNYFSITPMGVFAIPLFATGYTSKIAGRVFIALSLLDVLSSPRFHYPIGKNLEVFASWDAFKLTRMKDISSAWYVTGDLRAGFNCYVNKKFVISSYYEYNHNHNLFTRSLNWALGGIGVDIPDQPTALNGHSVGIHIGYSFTLQDAIDKLDQKEL